MQKYFIILFFIGSLYAVPFTQQLLPGDPEIGISHGQELYDITFAGIPTPVSDATLVFDTSGDINNAFTENINLFIDTGAGLVLFDVLYDFNNTNNNIIDTVIIPQATLIAIAANHGGDAVFSLQASEADTAFHTINSATLSFEAAQTVPEPSTYIAMFLGLILLGFRARKTRKNN